MLGLAHLCRPQAESTRIETKIPGNDFVELVVGVFMALRRDQIFWKTRRAKETKIFYVMQPIQFERRKIANQWTCVQRKCAQSNSVPWWVGAGINKRILNGASSSRSRALLFTWEKERLYFLQSQLCRLLVVNNPSSSLSGWGWWPILSSCDHVCSVTSPPTYVETKSCLTDGGSLKQIISLWGLLIL